MTPMVEHALALVARGFAVFPVHGIVDGACSCGETCDSPGKHPIPRDGLYSATRDEEEVRAWWDAFPAANVGTRTGDGVLVVDVDPRNGGDESYARLVAEHPEIERTLVAATGGGGLHLFFRVEGTRRKAMLARGVDLKCDGGYVVGAGSRHASGGSYEWLVDAPIADAPTWLDELAPVAGSDRARDNSLAVERQWSLLADAERARQLKEARAEALAHPPAISGQRGHDTTIALAGRLCRGHALPPQLAFEVLRDVYNARCEPPWSDAELWHKVDDATEGSPAGLAPVLLRRLAAKAARPIPRVAPAVRRVTADEALADLDAAVASRLKW